MAAAGPGHRADIEGLRGIAVLSVFAVHSVPHALRGGFIGVDVFFVLSGYLIATLTLAEQAHGRFSIADFYARRLRRLAPALLLVLLSCLGFAAFVALPKDARDIGRHVMGGAGFVSNLVLWREAGYFDQSSERKLLLHLWSLGIEEQFYLLWPLAVPLLMRWRRHGLACIVVAASASFLLNVTFVDSKPKGVFFLPPTRFWELLVGVLLAWWQHTSGGIVDRRLPDLLSAAGVLLLGTAMWLIDKTDHFPGWWALFPTGATFLLLAAGPGAWVNRVLLAQPVLTFYGRISYPLYLWHWPLLTMPLLLDRPRGWEQQITVMAASVTLATLTYYGVERPLRFGRFAAAAPRWLAGGLLVVAAAGAVLVLSDGRVGRYPPEVRPIAEVLVHTDYAAYRVERCFLRSEQRPAQFAAECVDSDTAGRPLWLLWGDSHAAALYPGLRDAPAAPRLAQFTAAACPPGWRSDTAENPHCREVNEDVLRRIARLRPATVLLAARWLDAEAGGRPRAAVLRETVAALTTLGAEVVVVGPLPRWPLPPPRHLLAAWAETGTLPERAIDALDADALALDRQLAAEAQAAGARYLSPLQTLCDTLGCLLSLQEQHRAHAVAFDETHLTAAASRWLVRQWWPR